MLLSAEHLSINFGSRQLLDDVNFYLNEGDKTGVIGINGTGKSTFLKVLAGLAEPDGGSVTKNPNVQVSFLAQNPAMEDEATVLEQVFLHHGAQFRELNEYANDIKQHPHLKMEDIFDYSLGNPSVPVPHALRRSAQAGGPGSSSFEPGGRAGAGRAYQPLRQRDGHLAGGLAAPVPGRSRHGDP